MKIGVFSVIFLTEGDAGVPGAPGIPGYSYGGKNGFSNHHLIHF